MAARLLSSHLILLPGGVIGKWPVVKCSDSGEILHIETHPEGFKERPGLEWHSGMMIPGLIDIAATDNILDFNQHFYNRHFAMGTILAGIPANATKSIKAPPYTTANLQECELPHEALKRLNNLAEVPVFDRFRLSGSASLMQLATVNEWAAAKSPFANSIGKMAVGYKPGILLLRKTNENHSHIIPESTIKWLIVPKKIS